MLHEACWADGGTTRWSAERLLPEDATWTAEHVFPWLFEEYGALTPRREAADALAALEWPRLYDPDQLAANEVPVAAAVYAEDLYVERALSEETAAATRGMRLWLTNEYEHNGLRADGGRVLGHLLDLVQGRA